MKLLRLLASLAAAALFAASALTRADAAMPLAPNPAPETILTVAADCNSLAQQYAAQYGGRAKPRVENRGGKRVCVIVIVVDGKNNERGQRIQKVVPLD